MLTNIRSVVDSAIRIRWNRVGWGLFAPQLRERNEFIDRAASTLVISRLNAE